MKGFQEVDDKIFKRICSDLKEIQHESNNGDWLMNQFLMNSFPNLTNSEAMKRLNTLEKGN